MRVNPDSPQVAFPPPLLLLGSILFGVALQFVYPLSLTINTGPARWLVGTGLVASGLLLTIVCIVLYNKAKTAIEPWRKTNTIIRSGPYRWSRNPIYLSFLLIGLGVAIILNNSWIALLQLPHAFLIGLLVIAREEAYLEKKFGEEYLSYKRHVRKWC